MGAIPDITIWDIIIVVVFTYAFIFGAGFVGGYAFWKAFHLVNDRRQTDD